MNTMDLYLKESIQYVEEYHTSVDMKKLLLVLVIILLIQTKS